MPSSREQDKLTTAGREIQRLCRRCNLCNFNCSEYQADICERLRKPPYVCNGCGKKLFCTLEKTIYFAAKADQKYREVLSESRTGISYTEEQIQMLDKLISPLIKQGQSPHHIYVTNKDSIMVSERTIYNLIDASVMPEAYSLPCAVGSQLDCLAAAIGLTRVDSPQGAGATDAEFRAFIQDKLALWRTDGTNGSA